MDWDTALRRNNGRINPLGLYDLDRNIRPVGKAYKQLIADWGHVLPTHSVCLQLPIVMPQESHRNWAQQQEADAKKRGATTSAAGANTAPAD